MARRAKTSAADASDAAVAEIRARARAAGAQAIDELLRLARDADSESVRLAAIKELLDRAYGRSGAGEASGGGVARVVIDDGYAH